MHSTPAYSGILLQLLSFQVGHFKWESGAKVTTVLNKPASSNYRHPSSLTLTTVNTSKRHDRISFGGCHNQTLSQNQTQICSLPYHSIYQYIKGQVRMQVNINYRNGMSKCAGIVISNDLLHQEWAVVNCTEKLHANFYCSKYLQHRHITNSENDLNTHPNADRGASIKNLFTDEKVYCPRETISFHNRCIFFRHPIDRMVFINTSNFFMPKYDIKKSCTEPGITLAKLHKAFKDHLLVLFSNLFLQI